MTENIQSALSFISPDDRDVWITIGMAIKHELGDAGHDLWDSWSQGSQRYEAMAARASWRSFKAVGGVTIGSLFHEAKMAGWVNRGEHHVETQAEINARHEAFAARASEEGKKIILAQDRAARKAGWIVKQCKMEEHAYLDAHGIKDKGLVWMATETDNLLVIPMRIGRDIVGCQLIDRDGSKRFLTGQRCTNAEYVIDAKGILIWCEGYATGLAVRAAMSALKIRYTIHICFSAHNMKNMAEGGFVVADNDYSLVGIMAAKATGLPFWISDTAGEDFCDYLQRVGLFAASQSIRKIVLACNININQ